MRHRMQWSWLIPALLVAGCAPAPAPPAASSAADEAAVRQADDAWRAMFNAADADGLGRTYDDDIVQMQPDGPPLAGPAAIVEVHRTYFSDFTAVQASETDEVVIFGDVAMSRGTWRTQQTPKAGGDEQMRNGKWMVIYKRQPDRSWKLWRWMWNQESATADGGN